MQRYRQLTLLSLGCSSSSYLTRPSRVCFDGNVVKKDLIVGYFCQSAMLPGMFPWEKIYDAGRRARGSFQGPHTTGVSCRWLWNRREDPCRRGRMSRISSERFEEIKVEIKTDGAHPLSTGEKHTAFSHRCPIRTTWSMPRSIAIAGIAGEWRTVTRKLPQWKFQRNQARMYVLVRSQINRLLF